MKTRISAILLTLFAFCLVCPTLYGATKLKALIIDGQNNHDWKTTTPAMKWMLEETGRFTVEVFTATGAIPDDRQPKFSDYDVIVSNYNGQDWPEAVRTAFTSYVRKGGGLVIVHAADNSFGNWADYNEMIGVGGWGGRNEKSGPMLYWQDGKIVRDESAGSGGTHGANHEFVVETRAEHPILRGLPTKWMHASDEMYAKMRGPASNLTVIATAFSAPDKGGTGKHEPILMVLKFGKGRVFHTVLGHDTRSMYGTGFEVTLTRGTEWAATGKVTLKPPKADEMPADKVVSREPAK
jgi:type 1 glutamine amidotransferase